MTDSRFFVLFALVVVFFFLSVSLKRPRALRLRELRGFTNTAADGYTLEVSNLIINNEQFHFLFYISNTGALTQEVAVDFGPQGFDLLPPTCPTHANYDKTYHIVRELGPSARVFDAWMYGPNVTSVAYPNPFLAASAFPQYIPKAYPPPPPGITPIKTDNTCNAMIYAFGETSHCPGQYGGGFIDTPTDPFYSASTLTKYICYVTDLENKNVLIKLSTHFRTMTILATTSEHEDLRVWNLICTYKGLGLLSQVRGSVITLESFLSGYTPLFDDTDAPDCGQRTTLITGSKLNFNSANPVYGKVCGQACAIVPPYTGTSPVIWEMASRNGRYRLQFFDSGNVSFIDTQSIVPIYSTIPNPYVNEYTADFPICFYPLNPKNTGPNSENVLEKQRDAWIIRGATFFATLRDSNYFVASNVDLMVQITNYGALVLQKDYKYGSLKTDGVTKGSAGLFANDPNPPFEAANTSHIVVQSAVPSTAPAQNATLATFTVSSSSNPATDNVVTPSPLSGGSAVAIGSPSVNDTQYYQQHYSLGNVLVCQGFTAMAEYDWENGTTLAVSSTVAGKQYYLWLGPFGLRLLYLTTYPQSPDLEDWTNCLWITNPYTEWFYHHDTSTPNPLRVAQVVAMKDCSAGAQVLRCSLPTCGTFQKPVQTSSDTVLLTLRSPNKRYCFYMLSSGVCRLTDGFQTTLFSTDDYVVSTTCDQSTNSC